MLEYILHLNDHLALLVNQYGFWTYLFLFLVIFCETGIVIAAFLPGDSLLFAVGAVAATGGFRLPILIILLIAAGFLGNSLNYWVGNKLGHVLFVREDALFFKKSYLNRTHAFYERYGARTLIMSCFIPVIRTLAPFVAGLGEMTLPKFLICNFLGVTFWVSLMLCVSFWFGHVPFVRQNFIWVIFAIILISLFPPFIEAFRHYARARGR